MEARLFEPDTILPEQQVRRSGSRAAMSGEFRLMTAILEDAIDMYRKHADARQGRKRQLFDEAEAWIESDDRTWIFSFETICHILDLDPDCLRQGLRAHKRRARGGEAKVIPLRRDPVRPIHLDRIA